MTREKKLNGIRSCDTNTYTNTNTKLWLDVIKSTPEGNTSITIHFSGNVWRTLVDTYSLFVHEPESIIFQHSELNHPNPLGQ